ncbi:GNAT family N-acetyltransferase [Roseibium aestuarii]|uniref:GNAT family N-acetyltransferase n=1 Tax=Roseibium aestuarii TaxID=2600299 RepID=A0ABW4JT82_9HYPH|nr:GNAT family N-acetyltransferase [Roseibium aestuarii]
MTRVNGLTIAVETPLSDDMRQMVSELNALLLSMTSEDACHHLSVEEMADARTTVFVARVDGRIAACGALHRHERGVGEVKRMYTRSGFQGRGLGRAILDKIITAAKADGLRQLVLETGVIYVAARQLYERAGFEVCGPVLDYPDHPESVFYSRSL